jgi:transcription termination factor Rho
VDIAELKRKSVSELQEMADGLKIDGSSGLRKQDLIFQIEQNLLDTDIMLHGDGVLEILPKAMDSCAARTGATSRARTTSVSPSR